MPDTDAVKDQINALIAASDMPDMVREIYAEGLLVDPAVFARTGAYEMTEGLEAHGIRFLLDGSGGLKDLRDLGFTPQTVEALIKSAARRRLAATLTTGADLFKQLTENPGSVANIDDVCEAAPGKIKKEFITAVYAALEVGKKARTILQQTVNYATGVGDAGEEGGDSFYRGWGHKDRIDRGVSYVSKALKLPPQAHVVSRYTHHQHPIAYVLAEFIRSLPKGEGFEIDPPKRGPRTLDEQLARPLRPDERETADRVKDALFGPGWRNRSI